MVVRAVDVAGREPRHNIEAERAVLASVLSDPRVLDFVRDVLPSPSMFHSDAHQKIYAAILALQERGAAIDPQTVHAEIVVRDWVEAIGGSLAVEKLLLHTPTITNPVAHAQVVRGFSNVRAMVATCSMIAAEGYGDFGDFDTFLQGAERRVCEVALASEGKREGVSVHESMVEMIRKLGDMQSGAMPGVSTGLKDLDEQTGGFCAGDLTIVAGRPGMGKTAFVLGVTEHAARPLSTAEEEAQGTRYGVCFFSLEMPHDQLSLRLAAAYARQDIHHARSGKLGGQFGGSSAGWDAMQSAAYHLASYPIWIDDDPMITVAGIRASVRHRQAAFDKKWPGTEKWKQRIGLVIVDYLQLLRPAEAKTSGRNREQEISEMSRGLKALAKELKVPVVALSQLNRSVETRGGNKRPQLSDLRESGAIEQDADVIQFLYRPEYYKRLAGEPVAEKEKGYAEVIVAKQRNGPTGKVPVTFIDGYARFENRAKDAWREEE